MIAKLKECELEGLTYQEICQDTCAFGVNVGHVLSDKVRITKKNLAGVTILCGTYSYMEQPFEKLLFGCRADLQVIPSQISAGSVGIVTRAVDETYIAQLKELLAVDICCKTGHQKV